MGELSVLRAIGLAGVADRAAVVAASGSSGSEVDAVLAAAEADGLLARLPRGLRLTPDGRSRVAVLLDAERAGVDAGAANELFDEFARVDREFKELVTEYQTSGDPSRLSWAVARLTGVHAAVIDIVERAAALVPRLAAYRPRLERAMARLERGNAEFLASVTVDSYHTIWFGFHEELFELAGRVRADEEATA